MSLLLEKRSQPLCLLFHLLDCPRLAVIVCINLERLMTVYSRMEARRKSTFRLLKLGINVVVVRKAIAGHFPRQYVKMHVRNALSCGFSILAGNGEGVGAIRAFHDSADALNRFH